MSENMFGLDSIEIISISPTERDRLELANVLGFCAAFCREFPRFPISKKGRFTIQQKFAIARRLASVFGCEEEFARMVEAFEGQIRELVEADRRARADKTTCGEAPVE